MWRECHCSTFSIWFCRFGWCFLYRSLCSTYRRMLAKKWPYRYQFWSARPFSSHFWQNRLLRHRLKYPFWVDTCCLRLSWYLFRELFKNFRNILLAKILFKNVEYWITADLKFFTTESIFRSNFQKMTNYFFLRKYRIFRLKYEKFLFLSLYRFEQPHKVITSVIVCNIHFRSNKTHNLPRYEALI